MDAKQADSFIGVRLLFWRAEPITLLAMRAIASPSGDLSSGIQRLVVQVGQGAPRRPPAGLVSLVGRKGQLGNGKQGRNRAGEKRAEDR